MCLRRNPFIDTLKKYALLCAWLVTGFSLNHFLWAFSFDLSNFTTVNALPNRIIHINSIYLAIPILWLFSLALIITGITLMRQRILVVVFILLLIEGCFQFFGRGLIKFVIDALLSIIFFARLGFDHLFVFNIDGLNKDGLKIVHDELIAFLRISVTLATFILGVAGVSFALNFLKTYYNEVAAQYKMWWYAALFLYAATGIANVIYKIGSRIFLIRKSLVGR
jgi:hypothetical protein